jgi:endonuclease-3
VPRSRSAGRVAPTPARARRLLNALEKLHPEADCALHFANAYQLLVATILSAQCTDERVNQVTPALFRRYPSPRALARADPAQLEEAIRSTGFFRSKARSLLGCAAALVERHRGRVPGNLDELVKLPGVGRKTANVVLGHAFDTPAEGIAVDTHVLRVANRLGIAGSGDAGEMERSLMALVPRERWTRTTDLLIFHGRKVCHARRPDCGNCGVIDLCAWEERAAAARTPPRRGKASRPGSKR